MAATDEQRDLRSSGTREGNLDGTKRELMRRLATGAYVAPAALAMLTMKAQAAS